MLRRFEILLIGLCLLATFGLFNVTLRMNEGATAKEFQQITERGVRKLEERMETYAQSLNATAAYLLSSEMVLAEEFDQFVDALEIDRFLPGINGIGFIEPVQAGAEDAFLGRMQLLGSEPFDLHPETGNSERLIISRISPYAVNKEALGLDISFEQGRLNAALEAREAVEPRLTPRILLVQEASKEPGFLLLRPLSRSPETGLRAGDEPAFLGWVYAPFVGRNLMTNLTTEQMNDFSFQVYDGVEADPDSIIFESANSTERQSTNSQRYQMDLYGRSWLIEFQSTPLFEANFRSITPAAILAAGALLTAMLVFALYNLRARGEALGQLAALRKREVKARDEENRSIIENAVTPVFILNGADKVQFANQAALDCFGYLPAEMDGLYFPEIVHSLPVEKAANGYNAEGLTADGQSLKLDLQRNAWLAANGEPRITAIVRDLTTEYETQKELENTKTLYDLALQGAQIGVFDIDMRSGQSDVSDTWCQIMEIDPNGTKIDTQKNFLSRIHPADLQKLKKADKDCIDGVTSRSICEYRLKFEPDKWRWMRSDAVVVDRDENGQAIRMIGTQTDITEIHRGRNALELSEQRFRNVIAAAPIGMVLMDEDGKFVEVNEAFCTLTGCGAEELTTTSELSDFMSYDERKKLFAGVSMAMNAEDRRIYQAEHQVTNKAGEERWGLFNISWSFDKNEDRMFFIAQINDITDKKQIEHLKNEFVSTVSHELRTPLTSIKGALGLIEAADGASLSRNSKRLIDIARSNTDRLTIIVNDILDLEKISSGDVSFDFESTDMRELAHEVVQEVSPYAVTHHNTLALDLPDNSVWVEADRGRTKQVLTNLISNACKYSDDDSEVVIKLEELDDVAIVYVQNSGPGVPESFKPQIFQAFSQADGSDTRAKGGTGLGLNISKQIVNRHNGEIGFQSIPGKLTVFWFTYPRCAAASRNPVPIAPFKEKQSDGSKLAVLHVEADGEFAEVIKSGLQDVANVTHSGSNAQAREKLESMDFDVIIVDRVLPDGLSSDLLDEIRENHPCLRILGLSADADLNRDDRMEASLIKSRTELATIADYVRGRVKQAS